MIPYFGEIILSVCVVIFAIVGFTLSIKRVAFIREQSKATEKIVNDGLARHRESMVALKEITEILKRMEKKM